MLIMTLIMRFKSAFSSIKMKPSTFSLSSLFAFSIFFSVPFIYVEPFIRDFICHFLPKFNPIVVLAAFWHLLFVENSELGG